MKILFVDDVEDIRDITKAQLEMDGFSVDVADSAAHGIELLSKTVPDLILSDIFMPDVDGFEFCHQVKSNPKTKGIPFIFYTSTFVHAKDKELAAELGAVKFLTKPIRHYDFLRELHEAIDRGSVPEQEERGCLGDKEFSREHSSVLTKKLFDKTEELERVTKEFGARRTQFYQLLNSIEEPVAEISEELRFVRVNNAFLSWLDCSQAQVLGAYISDVLGDAFSKVFTQLKSSETFSELPYVFDIGIESFNHCSAELRVNLIFNYSGLGERYVAVFSKQGSQAKRLPDTAANIAHQVKSVLGGERLGLQHSHRSGRSELGIVGKSEKFASVIENLKRAAPSDCVVLLQGESGTGKELVANAIHAYSDRRNQVLIKVNCGAIVPGLFESELFGHEKGAFTGAVHRRVGRFEQADNGTIFLDEVSELSLDLQVKLLRVLQEGVIERVGGDKSIKVDVRVVVAANKRLGESVQDGLFRSDLYYRLNVFPIDIPPLRERQEDIPVLAEKFLAGFGAKLRKVMSGFSDDAMTCLLAYQWPGNIRQLQNVIERAVIVAQRNVILRRDLNIEVQGRSSVESQGITLLEVEIAHIQKMLEQTNWVIAGKGGAAEILGMNPSTLRSRMQKYGIRKG
ncbi:sigma 54-interacting transcriptional regulator [Pseudomonadota bacterium]